LLNAEPSTLKLSNYTLDATDTYSTSAKESKVSANKLALNSTLFSYPVKETKTLADELVFTSFLRPIKDKVLDNELSLTIDAKPTTFKKHLGTGLKKIFSNQQSSINTSC